MSGRRKTLGFMACAEFEGGRLSLFASARLAHRFQMVTPRGLPAFAKGATFAKANVVTAANDPKGHER